MKKSTTTLKYIALLACVALISGCMSTKRGTDFNSTNISKLKVGETTENEVIELIGQPVNRTRNSDGTVYLNYMYSPGQTVTLLDAYNPSFNASKGTEIKSLSIILDANGKVKSFTESGSQ